MRLDRYARPGDRHFLEAVYAFVQLSDLLRELDDGILAGYQRRFVLEVLLRARLRRSRLTRVDRFLLAMLHDCGFDVSLWMSPAKQASPRPSVTTSIQPLEENSARL